MGRDTSGSFTAHRRGPAASDQRAPATAGSPWGIQTTDGKSCRVYTGLTKLIAGKVMTYGCSGGGGLIGQPRKQQKLWRIRFAKGTAAPVWKGVKTAWY